MTMWRPNEPAEEDVSAPPPGMDLQNKRRRSRRHARRDGLADQTVVKTLEDLRSYRAFELPSSAINDRTHRFGLRVVTSNDAARRRKAHQGGSLDQVRPLCPVCIGFGRSVPDDTAIDDRAHPARIDVRHFTRGIVRQCTELAVARYRIGVDWRRHRQVFAAG